MQRDFLSGVLLLHSFEYQAARKAFRKHVLARGEIVGTYTQNPALPAKPAKRS